jgi:hypothetical protein
MHSTVDIFPCDLGDPILIPVADVSETDNKTIDRSIFGNSPVPSQGQDAEEWEDIT